MAADFFVSPSGNDSNSGTQEAPFQTIGFALTRINLGDVLYLRGGEYRMMEQGTTTVNFSDSIVDYHIEIRGYPGERAILLGSINTQNKNWYQYTPGIWRIPADFLTNDPTGMFKFNSGHISSERISHGPVFFIDGRRSHHHVADMEENTWTKADINGIACGTSNAECYLYFKNSIVNPNDHIYEFSQRGSFYVTGTDYFVFENLEVYYTQSAGIFTEGCDNIIIRNCTFGHNSNGDDNSYSLRIWSSGGALIANNKVFDSEYWGGYSNSKGITFMIVDPANPHIVENNEIYDIAGSAAVGVKGGVSNLIVRNNYIHDVVLAFHPGDYRCTDSTACDPSDPRFRPGGSWKIYNNLIINSETGIELPGYEVVGAGGNVIYNNTFYNVETAVGIGWDGAPGNIFKDNIFANGVAGFYLSSGGTTTTVEDYLDQFDSYNNIFFNNSFADIHLRPNWGGTYFSGTPYFLDEFKSIFAGREVDSLSTDPMFGNVGANNFHPATESLACGNASDGGDIGAFDCFGGEEDLIAPSVPSGLSIL